MLHVAFTMDCEAVGPASRPGGPRNWELSSRSIDGFCTKLLRAGYPATLFLSPECAWEHAPLFEELADCGVELGLYVQPQTLSDGRYSRHLGHYRRDEQRAVVELAVRGFQNALGRRPQSLRSAMFSASDETYPILYELGFRQGSLSSPGRRVAKHAAVWAGAETDPHYVDARSRLRRGDLPFLEVPVTTDSTQVHGGLSPDLALEKGIFEEWHRPLIEGQLRRMVEQAVQFKVLCIFTRNAFDYHSGDQPGQTLKALVDYLDGLGDRCEVVPVTLAGAHASFRRLGLG